MTKTKGELLLEAAKLKLDLTEKNTVAEINKAIKEAAVDVLDTADKLAADTAKLIESTVDKLETSDDDQHYAKAGKNSEKALRDAEVEAERQARKGAGDTTPQGEVSQNIQKGPAPKTRPLVERKGKAYRKAAKLVDAAKEYDLAEALSLATDTAVTKFDSSVEMHVRLGVDPKQADQNIRTTVTLPNGTGKKISVAALVGEDDLAAASEAGADFVGEAQIIKLLEKGDLSFDVLIATPKLMPKLGKFARLLGPRGLMPNPKAGTVSANPIKAIKEAKSGKVEYRVDKQGIIHMSIGKVSFGAQKLLENATVFMSSVKSVRPTSLKGNYILSISVATTMGPGIKVVVD